MTFFFIFYNCIAIFARTARTVARTARTARTAHLPYLPFTHHEGGGDGAGAGDGDGDNGGGDGEWWRSMVAGARLGAVRSWGRCPRIALDGTKKEKSSMLNVNLWWKKCSKNFQKAIRRRKKKKKSDLRSGM
jgi:hypothetical protein